MRQLLEFTKWIKTIVILTSNSLGIECATITAFAPRANALNTSVPRLNPPSKKTGIFPSTATTTCNPP